MSRSTSGLVVILATGVVAALPLLAAAPAEAAPPRIEFSRAGLELLSCNSKPSDDRVTVAAESIVTFVNKLDEDATLRLDGRDTSRVRKDGSTDVLFHRGSVQVQLVPDCGLSLSSDFEAVMVRVEAPSRTPSLPASVTPAEPDGSSPAGSSQAGQGSRGSGSPRARNKSAAPSGSSGDADGATARASESASPSGAGAPGTPSGGSGLAAEPLSSTGGSGKNGPNGLLAITAVLCIVGVSVGAIRAIVAQRATRTSTA
jgi:hypothetical protein